MSKTIAIVWLVVFAHVLVLSMLHKKTTEIRANVQTFMSVAAR